MVKFLLDNGADPNIQYSKKLRTPLMLAIINQDIESIKVLLEYGADIKYIKQIRGDTVSLLAYYNKHRDITYDVTDDVYHIINGEIIKLLIKHNGEDDDIQRLIQEANEPPINLYDIEDELGLDERLAALGILSEEPTLDERLAYLYEEPTLDEQLSALVDQGPELILEDQLIGLEYEPTIEERLANLYEEPPVSYEPVLSEIDIIVNKITQIISEKRQIVIPKSYIKKWILSKTTPDIDTIIMISESESLHETLCEMIARDWKKGQITEKGV